MTIRSEEVCVLLRGSFEPPRIETEFGWKFWPKRDGDAQATFEFSPNGLQLLAEWAAFGVFTVAVGGGAIEGA